MSRFNRVVTLSAFALLSGAILKSEIVSAQTPSQIEPPDFILEEQAPQSIDDTVESLPSNTEENQEALESLPSTTDVNSILKADIQEDLNQIEDDSNLAVDDEAPAVKAPPSSKSLTKSPAKKSTRSRTERVGTQPNSRVRTQPSRNQPRRQNVVKSRTITPEATRTITPEANRRFIQHPNASKGLIRIDKEQVYHYRVKPSEQKKATSVRLGTYEPLDLVNPNDSTLNFQDLYDERNFPVILYDQEWQFFQGFGKLAWKIGAGFYLANGHGQFADNPDGYNQGLEPEEKFTLFVFPLNLGLIYRFQYFSNQWIVPYAEGGIDGFCFGEYRDDDKNPPLGAKLGAAPAAHASGGVSISLGKNARSFLDLDREYGINAVYLTAEFRRYFALSNRFDFSGDAITGGITAEY